LLLLGIRGDVIIDQQPKNSITDKNKKNNSTIAQN